MADLEVLSEAKIKGDRATAVEITKQVIADSMPAKEIVGGLVDYVIRLHECNSHFKMTPKYSPILTS